MPRYFFHFRTPNGLRQDFEGEDLADRAPVEEMAMASAKEIISVGVADEWGGADELQLRGPRRGRRAVAHFVVFEAAAKPGIAP